MTDYQIFKCAMCGELEEHPIDEPPIFCGNADCHSESIAPVSDELPFGEESDKRRQARLIGEIMREDEVLGLYSKG